MVPKELKYESTHLTVRVETSRDTEMSSLLSSRDSHMMTHCTLGAIFFPFCMSVKRWWSVVFDPHECRSGKISL